VYFISVPPTQRGVSKLATALTRSGIVCDHREQARGPAIPLCYSLMKVRMEG
jgi:hypothetical protein